MTIRSARRGQPVFFFAMLLLGWAGLRLAIWETPWPAALNQPLSLIAASEPALAKIREPIAARRPADAPNHNAQTLPPLLAAPERAITPAREAAITPAEEELFAANRSAAGHSLIWMAGMAALPMPTSVAAVIDRGAAALTGNSQPTTAQPANPIFTALQHSRWQADAWLLWRPGGARIDGEGAQPAGYGGSQAGAVLAFRLAPGGSSAQAYMRLGRGLSNIADTEAAIGLRARPVAAIPATFHAEVRVRQNIGGVELRPAAMVTSGFDRTPVLKGLEARGYAQAGYVGGRDTTAFADGQLIADHAVARFDLAAVRAGGGVWGGAQRGAARLDVGPTISVDVALGPMPARLSVDYRLRIAGEARPASGVALTLSTGF
ncbi:hypothetical protein [Qipengyuania marisflavi]|uniref:Uncharacterized protein n=1 Tax=Qipengyuania marisflavi TaxID=2486356 RepID=A0A5S3P6T1_9SPHN|nr:hypothetical protein [Qipengyuania marisflavi]TMM48712.1 hypothetical protein FEV51_04760 [Qipengyuania marisflavi]